MVNCTDCEACLYIGEGDSICQDSEDFKLVFDDWCPTEHYGWCHLEKENN